LNSSSSPPLENFFENFLMLVLIKSKALDFKETRVFLFLTLSIFSCLCFSISVVSSFLVSSKGGVSFEFSFDSSFEKLSLRLADSIIEVLSVSLSLSL